MLGFSLAGHARMGSAVLMSGALLCGVALGAAPADWPQWRGPDRSGVTPEKSGWPKGWPPKRLWGRNVGRGCTSPIIAGGRVYVMGWQGRGSGRGNPVGTDVVRCLDARSGKELWKQTYRCRYQGRVRTGDTGQYGGPNSTPTFDPQTKYLYTLSVDGDFRCWDTGRKGRPVWSANFYDRYKVPRRPDAGGRSSRRDFGFTSSPLIQGDLVIVEVGDDEGTVMAFDKRTGRRRWASASREPAGHTGGPVALTVRGVPCLANLSLRKLIVMRTDKGHEGTTVAEYDWQTHYACNIPTPAVSGSQVVLTSGYNRRRAELIEISLSGARRKWRSTYYSLVCTPVIHKGRIYSVDGSAKCLDLASGRLRWKGGSFGHGSCVVTGDDKLIVFGRGRLVLLDASPAATAYRELGRVDRVVRDTCYPRVAFADGLICCKDKGGNLVVFSVR